MPGVQTSNLGGSKQAGAWLGSDSMSQGMGLGSMSNMNMILQADQMGGQLMGLLAGQNESTVGNIVKSIPGLSTVGNLINAAFGSHINEEFVRQTVLGTNAQKTKTFNSNTNSDVLNDWRGFNFLSNVTKDEVGSDGWFSNKAKNKTNELNNNINAANDLAILNFGHAVDNADANSDLRIAQSMVAAYGGPINSFRKYYSFGGPFGNYFEGEGEQSNSLRSPHIDLAVSNPWLYAKLHPSKKTKKAYEPTTFAGRISQVAGASELGQKYVDYNSSVLQQIPVVGLGISALDLGYDANRLYHNPSLSTTKDVALDAASLLPALRKTMKGWWMKGNSGSFITEGGQIINNPRLASSLEVMLQPYRTAVNTGIYAGRAVDFLDDSSAYLKEMWDHSPIGKAINEHSEGGYLSKAKALIRQNEGWREKPYKDAPKGKNWRSVGYGFNDSGFREKYPEGISKHYEHGITKKQAEEELDYFLNKAEKQLKSIYGKQWNDFSDSQKAAILDTYYQRPASVGKSSRFYKAVTAGEDAGRYLGVAGYDKRNKIRQGVFGGDYSGYSDTESNPSTLQEVTPIPVIQDLNLEGITPTQAKALELNLSAPAFDLSMFSKPSALTVQPTTPTVGTVEDFLSSYGDFEDNLFDNGGWMDFFNAWGQAQGGNNYFGNNNWKPSDGLQTNTSNGSVQDWMGVASSVVNTVSNWGKEDPSLGRGGGYSQFGMAAYDLMKTIRDATKHRKEPMDRKLGIPIYARGGRLFAEGGSVGAMGYAQIGTAVLKLASNAKHQASLDDDIDEGKINRSIDRQGYSFSNAVANVQTNGDLLDLWQNYSEIPANLTMRDFRDKSLFDDFLNGYAASWEGFNAGQNFGPWGAAIGAIVGGLSSNISSIIGRNKASNAADDTNKRIERANQRNLADLNYAAERVDAENDLRILQNMGANGGKLSMGFGLKDPFIIPDGTANPLYRAFGGGLTHGAVFDTGINFINEGGSHGQNPLGGVPVGADEQGIPNLVEEGEAIWNGDYVFSKRMKVPKKLAKKYGLGGDMTFADAIAKLTKDSEERPLSNIDRATNDHILGEFADSQEELRMAKAQRAMDKEIQLQDDFLTGFQFGLGGHMSPLGIVPDADNISPFEKAEKLFAYGGAMGNIFEGEGDRPNTFNLDAANQSLVRRIFGDTGFTRFMENTSAALDDPIGYFAGDEINAVIDKLGKMSEPQLERFFRTDIGRAIAPYLAGGDNSQVQESGMRGAKSVANIVRRVQRPVQIAAKKAMAQSRQAARGQMRTPKGGGSQKVLNETTTPVQQVRQPIRDSGLPEGWGVGSSNLGRASGRTQAFQRGLPKDTFDKGFGSARNLAGTMDFGSAPIGSGNFGYLPWAAGIGAGGYGLYKGIDWLADNLTNPDGTISGVNDPAPQAAINSLPSEATSNRGNGNKGKAAVTETSAITPEETGAASTRRGAQGSGRGRGNGSGTATRNSGSVVPFAYDWYRNGSDGIGTPTGFKVGKNGKAYDYTPEYKALVDSLGADDIRKWAAEHPNDPSLKSFLAKGNKLENLKDDQWRKGATDGKYGFMHHVAEQKLQESTRGLDMPEGNIRWTPDPTVIENPQISKLPTSTTTSGTGQSGAFSPKQTWTRNLPWMMSGIMGLKEMLTPADYGNADMILDAAYRVGQPISVGTEYIGDYRRRDPFDERYLMNIINQNRAAANRNMMNFSGGNRAIGMAGILTNDLTSQMSLAEAARQAYLANRADDADVAAFNKDTNKYNATAQNTRNLSLAQLNSQRQQAMLSGISQGARLRQAIKDQRDAAIAANLSAFAQGLGDIGWENYQTNQINSLYNQGYTPYWLSGSGNTEFK